MPASSRTHCIIQYPPQSSGRDGRQYHAHACSQCRHVTQRWVPGRLDPQPSPPATAPGIPAPVAAAAAAAERGPVQAAVHTRAPPQAAALRPGSADPPATVSRDSLNPTVLPYGWCHHEHNFLRLTAKLCRITLYSSSHDLVYLWPQHAWTSSNAAQVYLLDPRHGSADEADGPCGLAAHDHLGRPCQILPGHLCSRLHAFSTAGRS